MLEHTSQLQQYAIPVGRKCYLYKRPKKKAINQRYTAPDFVGIQWCKSHKEALAFKAKYDKPLN